MEEAAKVAACSGISLQTVVHHSAHQVLPGFRLNRQPKSVRRDELKSSSRHHTQLVKPAYVLVQFALVDIRYAKRPAEVLTLKPEVKYGRAAHALA